MVVAEVLRAARDRAFGDGALRTSNSPGPWVLWAIAVERVLGDAAANDAGRTLVATGSFGRRELCPRSDIDVLLLTDGPPSEDDGAWLHALVAPLWDLGLQVGFRVLPGDGVAEAAAGDLTLATSLYGCRVVCGDPGRAQQAVDVGRGLIALPLAWPDVFAEDRARRATRHGPSPSMLEPNLKEGLGGLRDQHALAFLLCFQHALPDIAHAVVAGVLDADRARRLDAARVFTLRLRSALHLHPGRVIDRLAAESRDAVAACLGVGSRGGLSAGEVVLARWFEHAVFVDRTLRLLAGVLRGASVPPDPDSSAHRLTLVPGVSERVLRGGRRGAAGLPHVEVGAQLRRVLGSVGAAAGLRGWAESRLLDRVLPEWTPCRFRPQRSRAHLYAVDEHLLRCVEALDALETPDGQGPCPPAAEIWRSHPRPDLLRLAALLHDIAKQHGSAHSRVGGEIAERRLPEWGFGPEDAARVAFLVRHHLVLSDTAQYRDLHDPATLDVLRAIAPDPAWVDDLLVLTVADALATQPQGWTAWRRAMVEATWRAARGAASSSGAGGSAEAEAAVVARVETLLVAEVGHRRAATLARDFLAALDLSPPIAAERFGAEGLVVRAVLFDRALAGEGGPCWTAVRHHADSGWSEWIVVARDRAGLAAELAGSASAAGFNILGADLRALGGELVLDTFLLHDAAGRVVLDEARWRRLDRIAGRVLAGLDAVDALVESARRMAPRPPPIGVSEGPRVALDNQASAHATVVDLRCADRFGLFYSVCRILLDEKLDLRVARIATRHGRVSDTFYVVDGRGRKLGPRAQRRLERRLLTALVSA